MIQLNWNVTGTATDIPRTLDDSGHDWLGVLESETRCIFILPDTAQLTGGHTRWLDQNIDFLIPAPGAYEACAPRPLGLGLPPIVYAPVVDALQRLRVSGTRFVLEDGTPWFGLTTTDFLLFQRFLHGQDIAPIVDQRRAAGINEHRVTLLMQFLPAQRGFPILRPENYAHYWPALPEFAKLMASKGQRVKFTAMADMQHINTDPAWQRAFIRQAADTLRAQTNWRLECGNEWQVNGWHPREMENLPGVLMSRGSSSIDTPVWAPGFDWHDYHRRRDWPKYANGDDLGFISVGQIQDSSDRPRPVDDGEPVGFDEVPSPNRRLTQPAEARAVRYSAEAFAAATCFHPTAGLTSDFWGPVQERCAYAFCGKD